MPAGTRLLLAVFAIATRAGQENSRPLKGAQPRRRQVMFRALMNVRPSHLADPDLFDFKALATGLFKFDENALQLGGAD